MLGFRGHFSTKSRHYSTTFGALRAERVQHQRDHAPTESLWPNPKTTPRWSWPTGDSPGKATHLQPCRPLRTPCLAPHRSARRREASHDSAPADRARGSRGAGDLRSKLYELLASGAVASIRIDGSRRIPLTALEAYISGSSLKGQPHNALTSVTHRAPDEPTRRKDPAERLPGSATA
jgi:hypothetical protein